MKNLKKLALAFTLTVATSLTAYAGDFVKGKVKKVDAEKGKVTVIHEEIPNLEMPAMTMVFVTAEGEMTEGLTEGQEIEFTAERVNGKLTITQIRK
ncbi:MAG: copper-binding protein [Pseudomonadota bacterium]